MKFSEAWLREYVDPALTTEELVEQLTMAGLEVEGFEPVAGDFEGVIVAEILQVEAHPDADKLRVCEVNTGAGMVQVVCGAPNVEAGGKYPLATVGARLDDMKIKKAKLRGVQSFGMLCSERELGISENHEGLLQLPADAVIGESVRDALGLDDMIIEVDLTPNRSDCLGMLGLARETAALNDLTSHFPHPEPVPPTIDDVFPVLVDCPAECPRYVSRVIRGVNVNVPTPLWMIERLRRSGVRSIDPVVDVTNYVMLELGQPMHAFDLARLSDGIRVRMSAPGEQITLLDGSDLELLPDTMLITDARGPVAMAGVMGGAGSGIGEATVDLFLESAFFAPIAIAGRARDYGMATDAAHRFERGVDWRLQSGAIERATALLLEITGGEPGPVAETVAAQALPAVPEVTLRSDRVARMLGIAVDDPAIESMLCRLGFDVAAAGADAWRVTVPSHRFDVSIEEDLVEEIARVFGYNNLPVSVPRTALAMAEMPEGVLDLDRIKDHMVSRAYQEVITYSFVDADMQAKMDPENEPIGLSNPLSADLAFMRTSQWPGLVRALMHNLNRQHSRVRLFETGLRFLRPPNQQDLKLDEVRQEKIISGIVAGSRQSEGWANDGKPLDFFDVKGDLESLFALTGDAASFSFGRGDHPALHPGQTAFVSRDGEEMGVIGQLHPALIADFDVGGDIYLFELNLTRLCERRIPAASVLSRQPEIRRDIALIVPLDVSADELTRAVQSAAGDLLTNLKLFDVYQGKGIDPTRKSLALGLTFQHASRTLTLDEINDCVDAVVGLLTREFGASLRI